MPKIQLSIRGAMLCTAAVALGITCWVAHTKKQRRQYEPFVAISGAGRPLTCSTGCSNERVAAGSEDGTISVFDDDGVELYQRLHGVPIRAVRLNARGNRLLALDKNGLELTIDVDNRSVIMRRQLRMDDAIDLASISEDWSTVAVFSRNFYHISVMDRTSEQITWSSSLPPDAYSDKNIKRDPFLRNVGVDLSSNGSAVTYTRGIKKGSDGTRYALVTIVDVKTGRQKQVTVPLKSVKLDTVCMTPRGDVLVFFPEGILQIRHSPASVDLIFDKSVGTAADAEVDTTTSIVTIGCNDGLVIRKHLSWLNQFGKLPDN